MDHVVYLDFKAKELENLRNGTKKMIIRGAMGRKIPYDKVFKNDILFFLENNGNGIVVARARVTNAFHSEQLTKEESFSLIDKHQDNLLLNNGLYKRFGGKRYLVLISIEDFEEIEPFKINKTNYTNMDDWIPVEEIKNVKE